VDIMADGDAGIITKGFVGRPREARGVVNSLDMADAQWTVRGVPAKVRTRALNASVATGMTAGNWLTDAIFSYSGADGKPASASGWLKVPAPSVPPDLAKLLADLQMRIPKVEDDCQKPLFVHHLEDGLK
jgi:hypothetical protein